MRKITILALNGAAATGITGPMDVFHLSDLNWGCTSGREPVVHFEVKIASMNGKSARCVNRLYIEPHCSIHEVKDTDLIIIPAAKIPLTHKIFISMLTPRTSEAISIK